MRTRVYLSAAVLALAAVGLAAARQSGAAASPDSLGALHYRAIGPFRGGRVTAVAGVPGDHRTFYMGATGGGVWKTTDAGEVWLNVSDKSFQVGSVGSLAVAPSNPQVVYAGTGSSFIRNNVELGRGVYRSEDAGATWQLAGLTDGGQISKIRVDPRDPRHVYAAVLGHAFGPNPMRGIYRSHDGGRTWRQSFFVNDHTGAADLAMAPDNPDVLYAVFWTAVRNPWGLTAGSTDAGIYKTTDGGDHWTKLTQGLPAGPVGRIGITVSPARPSRMWAVVDAAEAGVYRSDDAGTTWQQVSADRTLTGRSWYYSDIFADSTDPNLVYAGNTNFYRSRDGGATWEPLALPHGDNHDFWIDPQDHAVMIEGNDGGACISVDGGATWSTQLNQNTAEIYRIVADDQMPYRLYGAQQDQYDAVSIPSRSTHFGERLGLQHWFAVGGMEGGWVALDPKHPDTVYATGPSAMITRLDVAAQHLRTINATVGGRSGAARFGWSSPVVVSPLDPGTVYHTSNFVDKSTDGGQTWVTISPDLTHNQPRGGGRGANGSEAEVYPTIDTLAVSPRDKAELWAGSDDGMVHLSRDGGATWKDVSPAGIPPQATVNSVEPSPHDAAKAYLAVFRYMVDDYKPYIYRTADFGAHWTLLTDGANGIPADQPVRVVREDPMRAGLLYAGTEFGMFVSYDDGAHWRSLQLDLPHVSVTDLVVHADDLDLATNGRGFWILDDIAPLRELAAQSFNAPHLFAPSSAYRITTASDEDDQAYIGGACCVANFRDLYAGARIERHQVGEEPPDGAPIDIWIPGSAPAGTTLAVFGSDGKTLRTLLDASNSSALHPGLNRFIWDLHVESEAPGTARPAQRGPKAPPGSYQIRLTAGGAPQNATLRLLGDPSSGVTDQAYLAQYDTLVDIQKALAEIQQANTTLQRKRTALAADDPARAELDALAAQLGSSGGGRGGGRGATAGGVTPLAGEFSSLYTFVAGSEDRPTGNAEGKYKELRQQLDTLLAKVGGG